VALIAGITWYTSTPDTLESVSRAFISKHLRSAATMALQRAAGRGSSGLESGEPVRFLRAYQPRTLRAILKTNTPLPVVAIMAHFLPKMALYCAGNKLWHEAFVLVQFSELRTTLLWRMPNPIPTSQLVRTAFRASSGQKQGLKECLDLLTGVADRFHDEFGLMAAYDASRIMLKQGRLEEVEHRMDSARKGLVAEPAFSPTTKGGIYLWIVKTLCLARVRQKQPAKSQEAQEALLEAYDQVKRTMDDDMLAMLHIEMLLASFHRKYGVQIPLDAAAYDKSVKDRFKRMLRATSRSCSRPRG